MKGNAMRNVKIIKIVTACANVANKQIDDFGMDIWVESMMNMTDEEFDRALEFLRTCYREQRLPKITDVESYAKQQLAGEEESQRAVDLIAEAIIRYGYTNPDRAKAYIGEFGWKLVSEIGGWTNICSIESMRDLDFAKTSWLKTAKILHKRAALGIIDKKPELPKPSNQIAPGLELKDGKLRLVKG